MTEFADGKILLVGLGNPGAKYAGTRHNIGRAFVERIAEIARITLGASSFDGPCGTGIFEGQQVVLLTPDTYMNRSGFSVVKAAHFYRIPVQNIIVAHDEIEIPFSTVRLKRGGGHAGHNGLRSIDAQLGDKNYVRIRLGVERPPEGGDVSNWVLGRFGKAEQNGVDTVLERGHIALEELLRHDLPTAQNAVHPLKA